MSRASQNLPCHIFDNHSDEEELSLFHTTTGLLEDLEKMQNSSNYLLVLPLLLYTSGITKPTVAGVGIPSMNVDSGCSNDGTQCDPPEDATSDITASWH